jgi:threonylcarbamoyladenosine tRNA methylthiotransferase MtaB
VPSFLVRTLGCRVNQYETEYVRQALLGARYREAVGGEPADLCIVNTCTVTLEGDYKSRKLIRALAREHPRAKIVVMGCYAIRAPEEVAALPGVVEVVTDKRQLPGGGTDWQSVLQRVLARLGVTEMPDGISRFGRLHRAYVKVQDGCRMDCSYCIVPRVRPVLWSRPVAEVLAEVRRLVDHGHLEIVLTGIHLGHYGQGMGGGWRVAGGTGGRVAAGVAPRDMDERRGEKVEGRSLADLVRRILTLEGRFRVRLSSLDAAEVSPGLLALMADHPDRVCPHLHVPLQSGSDAVLGRMRRQYTSGQFLERCGEIRRSLDQPALTTDAIVGFPGETEADFEATCRVVEEGGFSKLHVFRFSAREGTPAATMPDQVPGPVKQRRAAALAALGRRLHQRYCESLVGRRLEVLVEGPARGSPGMVVGTADRYVHVEIPAGPDRLHRLLRVTAQATAGGRIRAEVCLDRLLTVL